MNLYYGTEVLEAFVETLGGKIYPYRRINKPLAGNWRINAVDACKRATLALEPHLVIKRDIARRFLGALELFPGPKTKGIKATERMWRIERALAVAEIALTLNPPRARKTDKRFGYVDYMRDQLAKAQAQ